MDSLQGSIEQFGKRSTQIPSAGEKQGPCRCAVRAGGGGVAPHVEGLDGAHGDNCDVGDEDMRMFCEWCVEAEGCLRMGDTNLSHANVQGVTSRSGIGKEGSTHKTSVQVKVEKVLQESRRNEV